MEHWRTPYLGLRDIPPGLDDFELTTFFSYSPAELRCIGSRRLTVHRLAVALHIGFIRMTGRTLDAFERIPTHLWTHLGEQIGVPSPELGTLRSLYAERVRTLADHQKVAYQALGFRQITEHQRRYVVRWLRETLNGRADRSALLPELKRWFYEHRILLIADRELVHLIAGAQRDHQAQLTTALQHAYGASRLADWEGALTGLRDDGTPLQTWLWAAPSKQSTVQLSELFQKIEYLRSVGVADQWPESVNDVTVRHYARRCAYRPPSASKRITSVRRTLESTCFLRYALCTSSDQLLAMLRRWIRKMANDAARETVPKYTDAQARMHAFAQAVRALAMDDNVPPDALRAQLCALVDDAMQETKVSRAAMARTWLIAHPSQARAILARLLMLPLASQSDHPVIDALSVLREVYADKSRELPRTIVQFGRRWHDAIGDEDRGKALAAFEWATLFALRVALRNGSVYLVHSFSFRSQASLLISAKQWATHRNMGVHANTVRLDC